MALQSHLHYETSDKILYSTSLQKPCSTNWLCSVVIPTKQTLCCNRKYFSHFFEKLYLISFAAFKTPVTDFTSTLHCFAIFLLLFSNKRTNGRHESASENPTKRDIEIIFYGFTSNNKKRHQQQRKKKKNSQTFFIHFYITQTLFCLPA